MATSNPRSNQPATTGNLRPILTALAVFAVVVLFFFHQSFQSEMALFSNDGPLGAQNAEYASLPEGFTGYWQDLNWVGGPSGAAFPSITYALLWWLKPLGYAKYYEPLCILILAASAWLALRSMGLTTAACVIGGLAAALNSDLFSYTCWGLGSHALAVSSVFLALAALFTQRTNSPWIRLTLAGMATGMAVMEGFDSGAILSVYVAAVVLFQTLGEKSSEPAARRWPAGLARTALVAIVAGWTAAHALTVLIGTQVKGVVGMEQDAATKAQRWNEATRWSLPKIETLRLVIAGLHGYRMDTPDGGNYWGAVGRDPAWDAYLASSLPDPAQAPHPAGLRHSGAGFYTGVTVVLFALFALFQAARRQNSAFTPHQRRWVWFWGAAALISLLLALGRHAPFYQIVYALPYFSTIRNPIKFLHPFSLCMAILCAYGIHAALVHAVEKNRNQIAAWTWKKWWTSADLPDRRFTLACGALVITAVVGWLIYASSESNLVRHLQRAGFPDPAFAQSIASHSVKEVAWFLFFLLLGAGWLSLARSGFFRGPKATALAAVLAGGILTADLARANSPWVIYYNYKEKYASNPVIDQLRDQAHQHRVASLFLGGSPEAAQALQLIQQVYGLDWLQHLFPYYNIQSTDVVQDPRPSADNEQYRAAFQAADQLTLLQRRIRQWELTSTRYFVTLSGIEGLINQQLDNNRNRFQLHQGFQFYQDREDGPILTSTNGTGPFAIVEFTGALPKASLLAEWEIIPDPQLTLQRLVDPNFIPSQTVLLEENPWPNTPTPAPASPNSTGSVAFKNYAPKHIELTASAPTPSVLLLNDKFHPDWTVLVDGQPAKLLRANFLMRGVAVPAGQHTVEFLYQPSTSTWYVSLLAVLTGLALTALVSFRPKPNSPNDR